MKKKLAAAIAIMYVICLLFCGDGIGKRFWEAHFPNLTYSKNNKSKKSADKEPDEKKEIIEDETTTGSILTYDELAAMENENATAKNGQQMDQDQLAIVSENSADFEAAQKEDVSQTTLPDMDFDYIVKNFYQVDKTTYIGEDELNTQNLLGQDMTIEKSTDGPDILIYHTHSQEGYADSVSTEESETVVGLGDRLEELLTQQYGYKVLHHKGQYDVGDRDHAYSHALPEVSQIIKDNPSIKVVIDLHRDGVAETTKLATTIDGKPTAQIMFFNGLCRTSARGAIDSLPNQYLEQNLAFSFQMQLAANQYYPGLTRRIYLKGYRYNMHLCPQSLLVEVGAQTNTKEEAYNAMEPLADILDKVLKKDK